MRTLNAGTLIFYGVISVSAQRVVNDVDYGSCREDVVAAVVVA